MGDTVAEDVAGVLQSSYDGYRSLAYGESKMVALIAAMRKLITILNVMIRNGQPWKNVPQNS